MSKPAVFTAVGNKQTLLATVRDAVIAVDDEPVLSLSGPDRGGPRRARPAPRRRAARRPHHRRRQSLRRDRRDAARCGQQRRGGGPREPWETHAQQRLTGARFWVGIRPKRGHCVPGSTPTPRSICSCCTWRRAPTTSWRTARLDPAALSALAHRGAHPAAAGRWLARTGPLECAGWGFATGAPVDAPAVA